MKRSAPHLALILLSSAPALKQQSREQEQKEEQMEEREEEQMEEQEGRMTQEPEAVS